MGRILLCAIKKKPLPTHDSTDKRTNSMHVLLPLYFPLIKSSKAKGSLLWAHNCECLCFVWLAPQNLCNKQIIGWQVVLFTTAIENFRFTNFP